MNSISAASHIFLVVVVVVVVVVACGGGSGGGGVVMIVAVLYYCCCLYIIIHANLYLTLGPRRSNQQTKQIHITRFLMFKWLAVSSSAIWSDTGEEQRALLSTLPENRRCHLYERWIPHCPAQAACSHWADSRRSQTRQPLSECLEGKQSLGMTADDKSLWEPN